MVQPLQVSGEQGEQSKDGSGWYLRNVRHTAAPVQTVINSFSFALNRSSRRLISASVSC